MTTDKTDAWIAFDPEHRPPRAWRMSGATAQSAALAVDDLDAARALGAGDTLWTFDSASAATRPVPAKPAELTATMAQGAQSDTFVMAALEQARPFGRLAGAACRIEGFLSLNKDWDGVICLPGFQNTYWAQISADEVVSFLGFSTHSLVATFVAAAGAGTAPEEAELTDRLQDVLSKPETLALRLSETRAQQSAGRLSEAAAHGQIWGAALGAELAASRAYWLGQNLALIAPSALAEPYRAALASQYVPVTEVDEARMTLLGLSRARARTLKDRP